MDNIPSSFIGYNKQAVNEIIKQKDDKLFYYKQIWELYDDNNLTNNE